LSSHDKGQVAAEAAAVYEQFFVPALFAEWPARLLAALDVRPGQQFLDVACGTGILARAARQALGTTGGAVGLDVNSGMLEVARSVADTVRWQLGSAESLPFADHSFDRVGCQFGLMFFGDRTQAIAEMLRVTRAGGRIGVAVWAALDATPGYAAVAAMLDDLFGARIARSIEAPYSLGDVGVLKSLFDAAGASDVEIHTVTGRARFESIESWLYTDIKGWTLADVIDAAGYEKLQAEAATRLSEFVQPDGTVAFAAPAHIAVCTA
jgi:SAM-dependent methyltransferase